MGKKRRRTDEDTEFDLTRKAKEVKDDNEKRLIVILENAQLETVKVFEFIFMFNSLIFVITNITISYHLFLR